MRTRVKAIVLAAFFSAVISLYAADKPIAIGIVMDNATPAERAPLQDYLTKAMGRPVIIESPDNYRDTVSRLGDGSYDFACLGALMYIRARARYGVVPLVQRATDLHYHTVFITPSSSSIQSLSDLAGRQIAFGDVDSTSGHLMARYELEQAGLDTTFGMRVRYSGSHPATAALVAGGMLDAGAIDKTVFDYLIAKGKLDGSKVRVFATSKPYVDYVFVARKDVPAAVQAQFARALLTLKPDTDAAVLKVLRAKHFVVANDETYNSMRQIAHDMKMF
jgi:phosphonate transport system substrate-binding protein